jgi:hypothetical protein
MRRRPPAPPRNRRVGSRVSVRAQVETLRAKTSLIAPRLQVLLASPGYVGPSSCKGHGRSGSRRETSDGFARVPKRTCPGAAPRPHLRSRW